MSEIFEFFQFISDWLTVDIYPFLEEVFAQLITWVLVWKIKAQIFFVSFSWGVAKNILINIGLSGVISSAWASLDSQLVGYLTFLRLPECINLLLQAIVTRFVLNFMGW